MVKILGFEVLFKGALSGLRQFLAAKNPLKMMKNAFYFTLKALFVLLPNISRSTVNQTTKFGQLIGCNMRNIFFEKLYTKCNSENNPRLFSEKLKLSISLDQ